MAKNDRTMIAGLLLRFFPTLEKASSSDWAAFLDEYTGLNTPDDMPNGEAFDRWRKALADNHGLPVWGMSEEDIAEKKARAAELLADENDRRAKHGDTLLELKAEAPGEAISK